MSCSYNRNVAQVIRALRDLVGKVDDAITIQDDGTPDANYVSVKSSNKHDLARAIRAASSGPEQPGEDEILRVLNDFEMSAIPNDMQLDKIKCAL
jgi:hypothetical protein